MRSELDSLAALVSPPDDVPALDEEDVEALSVVLPADHLALMRRYGPGEFLPDLGLDVPGGAPGGGFDLAELLATYQDIHEARAAGGAVAIPVWPAPGGLLPWASDTDACALHFVTQGPPERWAVALVDYEDFTLTPLEGSSTAVLLALHRGTLKPPRLSGGALADHRCFVAAGRVE